MHEGAHCGLDYLGIVRVNRIGRTDDVGHSEPRGNSHDGPEVARILNAFQYRCKPAPEGVITVLHLPHGGYGQHVVRGTERAYPPQLLVAHHDNFIGPADNCFRFTINPFRLACHKHDPVACKNILPDQLVALNDKE
ncbi:MAG: hypothetical protein BWY89_01883 [Bacteroidetes bacterium ADurb.BinA012]|nr:MAG: hypothetical protein BWY89_01883 [Bacteroidetes bacterium ADurb.BinA012]